MGSRSSPPKNVRFYTLGCKVNQYETQAMREALERKGYRDIEGQRGVPCDLVVVNTCTVTQDSDRTNRYWIRRLRREHPEAQLAVTGCYVAKNHAEIEVMPEVDLIFTNDEKPFLAEKLSGPLGGNGPVPSDGTAVFMPLSISRSEGMTRAYVKIQDSCDHLVERLRPLKTHVFPYSRREGTRTAEWGDLPVAIIRERVRRLMRSAGRISGEVRRQYLGRSLEILAEHANERSGISEGFTPNFLKVFFEYPENAQGCIIPFKLTKLFQDGFRGDPGVPR